MWAQETTLCDFKTILSTQTLSAGHKSRVNTSKECKYTEHVTTREDPGTCPMSRTDVTQVVPGSAPGPQFTHL